MIAHKQNEQQQRPAGLQRFSPLSAALLRSFLLAPLSSFCCSKTTNK